MPYALALAVLFGSGLRSWIATVQALVGAFIDGASGRIVGMALAERDEVPDETGVRVLCQLKHEAEGRFGRSLFAERTYSLLQPGRLVPLSPSASHRCQFSDAVPPSISLRARSAWMRASERSSKRSTSSSHSSWSNLIGTGGCLLRGDITRARYSLAESKTAEAVERG